jgi:TldD protein
VTDIDPQFTAYPLRAMADAALQRARDLGAEHADFRAERIAGQQLSLADGSLQTLQDSDELGIAVRVIVNGTWGFAAAPDLTPQAGWPARPSGACCSRAFTTSARWIRRPCCSPG